MRKIYMVGFWKEEIEELIEALKQAGKDEQVKRLEGLINDL